MQISKYMHSLHIKVQAQNLTLYLVLSTLEKTPFENILGKKGKCW